MVNVGLDETNRGHEKVGIEAAAHQGVPNTSQSALFGAKFDQKDA